MYEKPLSTLDPQQNPDTSPASRNEATAAIDTKALFQRCMGSTSLALVLLREFEATGRGHLDTISQHATAGDSAAAADAAHALKGAAGILAASSVRSLAAEIEAKGRDRDVEGIASLVGELRNEIERCLAQVPEIRAQAAASGK